MLQILIKGIFFHIACLAIFTLIYFIIYENEFENVIEENKKRLSKMDKLVDCFYFSTTVEAGVGLTSLQPITYLAKVLVCIQQFCMIFGNIFIFYLSVKRK
jgi:hypothetical protein